MNPKEIFLRHAYELFYKCLFLEVYDISKNIFLVYSKNNAHDEYPKAYST